jgi:hypothetical protein
VSARAGPRCWAARASAGASVGARERAAQWAEPEGEKDRPEFGVCFSFSKF